MENACTFHGEGLTHEQMSMIRRVQEGFHCSEILLFSGLEAQGKSNPDLIRTVSALAGGVGFTGELCGALTGGACLIGLYTGRGSANEPVSDRLNMMVNELVDWFTTKYGQEYGGIRCRDITEDDPKNTPQRCPRIVSGVLKKVKSLLDEHGLEWERAAFSSTPDTGTDSRLGPATVNHPHAACPCSATAQSQ